MYAIVDVAGQQFKVEKGQKIFVHRLDKNEGDVVDFDQVLLIDQDGKVIIGEPFIKGALVTAKVLAHPRGDKVNVFKKKRRKGYKVMTGHRQDFTQILIDTIVEKGAKKKDDAPKTASSVTTVKTSAQKEVKTAQKEEKKVDQPAAGKKPGAKAETKTTEAPKASAAKKPAKKAGTVTKAAAKTTPVKKATTTKTTAGKAPAKKAATAKPAVKKAPAKKTATAKPAEKKATGKKK